MNFDFLIDKRHFGVGFPHEMGFLIGRGRSALSGFSGGQLFNFGEFGRVKVIQLTILSIPPDP